MKNLNITTLLIDFGGVIYNIDTNLTIQGFRQLLKGNKSEKLIGDDKKINYDSMPFISQYERGEISTNEFLSIIAKSFNIDLNETNYKQISNAWNATLIGLKPNIDTVLSHLAQNYDLFLLSNTNELHYNYFINECNSVFNKYFKKLFFSYKMGTNKPDLEIYRKVIGEINVKPENILFIDDSKENINAAKILNINTYLIENDNNSIYNLSDYLHTV